MLRTLMCGAVVLMSGASLAMADAKEDVTNAAKKLADSNSYSWKAEPQNAGGGGGGGGRGFGGPTEGKTEKDGYTMLILTRGDNTTDIIFKGDKAAVKTDEGWKTLQEAADSGEQGQPNPFRFMAGMIRNFKAPGDQLQDIIGRARSVEQSGDVYTAEMSEDGAKQMMTFGRGRRGGNNNNNNQAQGNGPQVSNAKASVKVWVTDGTVTKYETHVSGTVTLPNGDDRDVDRTTVTTIRDVGSTKVNVPEEAKKKLES